MWSGIARGEYDTGRSCGEWWSTVEEFEKERKEDAKDKL